ncbi:TRAP transporter large permease [Chitinasiproducens palmae]|uniref:TRAP transporter, DctM subunit n=1 Tax=Chitinasiproducens palmae TaxID=1770053 RepID=A0A1H2PM37_9BURK|nr:TRAP transporter large permease subunit [Chitinasiproducens palmae]SDV47115.1 TRAP transporter, DctM subunit [Chitinasiproducens palmae]
MRASDSLTSADLAPPRPGTTRAFLRHADILVGRLIEACAALLVLIETLLLLAGVVARYVLHQPLTWSDELASVLFLWLSVLGAVVALRRGEHMRMTALVARCPASVRAYLDAVAVAAVAIFVALILHPAYTLAVDDQIMSMPALEISSSWRSAALPVGAVLLLLTAAMRMLNAARPALMLSAVASVAVIGVALVACKPLLADLGNVNLVLFFVVMLGACVFAGVPIAFAFGLATTSYLALATMTPGEILVGRIGEGMSHLMLLSVPLFVFLGLLIEMTGMARRLVGFLAALLGHTRGGLSYVLLGAMYLVSGISGSKAADMAAIAPALFPEMRARGSKPGELVALLSAAGAQTETIPPSLVLITIGSVTGLSITALFTSGIVPALVVGALLCVVVWYRHRGATVASATRLPARELTRALIAALPALLLPFLIRFVVVEGIATATEASTIGIVYAVVVGLLIYRQFDWRRLGPMLVETASLSGAILIIIGAATGMAWALTQSGFSDALARYAAALPGGKWSFMAATVVGMIVLGSVLEGIPAIVLFGPLLFPIAKLVGIHEIHYAMVVILSMGIGLFAPPFGVGYYSACAVARVDPAEGIRPLFGYLVALVAGVVLVAAVPWFSTGFLH